MNRHVQTSYLKSVLVVSTVLSIPSTALAYRFTFSNHTNQDISMRFRLTADSTWFERVIKPHEEYQEWFKWIHEGITNWENNRRAGYCWDKIQIREWKEVSAGVMEWSDWQDARIIYIPSSSYTNIIEAGDAFSNALISGGIYAADAVPALSSQDGTVPRFNVQKLNVISYVGDVFAKSKCKNRHWDIIQDEEGIWFTTLAE